MKIVPEHEEKYDVFKVNKFFFPELIIFNYF